MQPNEITISVDVANDANLVNEVYSRFEEYLNRTIYIGDNHALASRNELALYRTFPKQSGNFKGVAKSAFKFTHDVVVPGVDGNTSLTSPIIMEVSFSIPVGAADADVLHARQRLVGLADLDTIMAPLNQKLMV
jgi:hypothetical protein